MSLIKITDTYQKINKDNFPNKEILSEWEYNRNVTNQCIRNVIVDAVSLCGKNTFGRDLTVQGLQILYHLKTGYFAYVKKGAKLPDKTFICKCDINGDQLELVVFADSKEDIEKVITFNPVLKRPYIISPDETTSKLIYLSLVLVNTPECIDIDNAVEVTDPDQCRLAVDGGKLIRYWLL